MNRYETIQTIFENEESKLNLIQSKKSKKFYVDKIINLATHKEHENSPYTELETLLQIQKHGGHKNIVHIYRYLMDKENIHIIQDYCSRGDLLEVLSTSPSKYFDESMAKGFFQQIANGLKFLHMHNIAHLDISLENVFLTKTGICKIGDFGLSTDAKKGKLSSRGKSFYIAPEMYNNEHYDPLKADIWALGIVLFIFLTGCPPFSSATESDNNYVIFKKFGAAHLLHKISKSAISHECRNLLTQLLCASPESRPHISDVLNHSWLSPSSIKYEKANCKVRSLSDSFSTTKTSIKLAPIKKC